MRLSPLSSDKTDGGRRLLHDDMVVFVKDNLKGFVSKCDDGALVGPFPPMLHFPRRGAPVWDYNKALIEHATLYCLVSLLLNAYDVPVPGREKEGAR